MRRMLLVLAVLPVALPATAQTTLGLRAGFVVGALEESWLHPEIRVHGSQLVSGPAIDIGLLLREDSRIGIRLGGGFARAGSIVYGYDRHRNRLRGRVSLSYLQFTALLRASPDMLDLKGTFLFGPWVGWLVQCTKESDVAGSCADHIGPDAGLAGGISFERTLTGSMSLGLDAIYYHGLTDQWGDLETRFVSLQLGLGLPIRRGVKGRTSLSPGATGERGGGADGGHRARPAR